MSIKGDDTQFHMSGVLSNILLIIGGQWTGTLILIFLSSVPGPTPDTMHSPGESEVGSGICQSDSTMGHPVWVSPSPGVQISLCREYMIFMHVAAPGAEAGSAGHSVGFRKSCGSSLKMGGLLAWPLSLHTLIPLVLWVCCQRLSCNLVTMTEWNKR